MIEECSGCGRRVIADDHICVVSYEKEVATDDSCSGLRDVIRAIDSVSRQQSIERRKSGEE